MVTGAASGIGLALAERFAALGMKVVMADIEAPALAAAEGLRRTGAAVLPAQPEVKSGIALRTQDLLELRNPTLRRG